MTKRKGRKGRNREIPSRFGTEFTSCRAAALTELIGAWADAPSCLDPSTKQVQDCCGCSLPLLYTR
jgi:hypothetical protein